MSPLLKSVESAGIAGMKMKADPSVVSPDDFFKDTDRLRDEFSRIIGNPEPLRTVIVPSVSYAMGNVVKNLQVPASSTIITVSEQFPSNIYPWLRLAENTKGRLKSIDPPISREDRGKNWNQKILEAIDLNTSLVALPIVHWTDGTWFDLKEIRKRTSEVGAALVIDGTQSIGALPFDITEIKPDALVAAGYKWLMGPYSIGMAYYGEMFDQGEPIEENWINRLNSENFASLVDYEDRYQPGALRYEVGEHSNFILVPMLLEALRQVNNWGVANIQDYAKSLSEPVIEQLRNMGYWIEDNHYRGSHLFGIRLDQGMDVEVLRKELAERKIIVSVRGSSIRVSVNVFNDEKDLAALVNALQHVSA